jgi:hypothetical protein
VFKKLLLLCKVLDKENLYLGSVSLHSLRIDAYENIWVTDIQSSYEMKRGFVIVDANKNAGMYLWDKELYDSNLTPFAKNYRADTFGSGSTEVSGTESSGSRSEDSEGY